MMKGNDTTDALKKLQLKIREFKRKAATEAYLRQHWKWMVDQPEAHQRGFLRGLEKAHQLTEDVINGEFIKIKEENGAIKKVKI